MDQPTCKPDADVPATQGEPLDRRGFLTQGIKVAGAAVVGGIAAPSHSAEPIGKEFPAWATTMGKPLSTYGQPSRFEEPVKRYAGSAYGTLAPGTGTARTPLEKLEGVITPNGLHYDRSHNGTPDIDPAKHKLLIHGLVKRPLTFSIAELSRYPMVSRICFVECAGNSSATA